MTWAHALHLQVHMSAARRGIALAFAAVTVGAPLGCASLGALIGVRPPRFENAGRPAEVRLLGPSLARPFGGAAIQLWARVENPNPFSLTLSTLSGRLLFEDVEAADVDLPLGLPLVSGEAQVIPLEISVGFENVPRLARILADAGLGSPLGYRLEGTIGVDAGRLGQPTFGPLTLLQGDVRVRR
jgi:late embryogenesis abundant protein